MRSSLGSNSGPDPKAGSLVLRRREAAAKDVPEGAVRRLLEHPSRPFACRKGRLRMRRCIRSGDPLTAKRRGAPDGFTAKGAKSMKAASLLVSLRDLTIDRTLVSHPLAAKG